MASKQDYYETLGVPRGAPADDVRKAYRRLARKYHPDLNPGDRSSEERFKQVQEAYDVLSDQKKRQMYDQFGFYSENGFPGSGPGTGAGPGAGAPHMDFGGFDFSDFFGGAAAQGAGPQGAGGGGGRSRAGSGASFRDLFSNLFRGESEETRAAEKGTDLEYALSIDFWQAIKGTQARFNITRHDVCSICRGAGTASTGAATCPQCNGTGNVTQTAGAMRFNLSCPRCGGKGKTVNACPNCHGEGRVTTSEPVDVRIPPGARDGSRLRVAGKGNAGTMGAPPGDLYITTRVEPHPFFHREGDDIEIKAPVAVWEAALGAKIELPTIDGKALLKIPQGTQNGQKFRMRGRESSMHARISVATRSSRSC
jgi:molecular chaperone DnaJ